MYNKEVRILKKAIIITASITVSIALGIAIIATVATVFGRLGYFNFGSTGNLSVSGTVVDGALYYEVPHKGIYKYTPDKGSKQILWKYWYDEYTVNNYAVYYTSGDTIYCIPHGTNESKEMYRLKGADGMTVLPCGKDIIVGADIYGDTFKDLLINGKTGKEIGLLSGFNIKPDSTDEMMITEYKTTDLAADEVTCRVGKRKITLKEVKSDDSTTCSITENGKNLLKKNETVFYYPKVYLGDCLVFGINNSRQNVDEGQNEILILRPDGRDSRITVNPEEGEGISGGDKNYLFDQRFDNNIVCIDAYTGKTWDIAKDKVFMYKSVVAADTDYLYITEYSDYDEPLSCYKIIYDSDNNPESLKLVNDNILQ